MDNLIDDLGGNAALAATLGCTPNAVSNWRTRGIPWRVRPVIAQLAEGQGVDLPKGFWGAPL